MSREEEHELEEQVKQGRFTISRVAINSRAPGLCLTVTFHKLPVHLNRHKVCAVFVCICVQPFAFVFTNKSVRKLSAK